ncbi:MAG TPA: ZIP family metal transporter [Patescibacteria group bacterium]|nr:ZIP family metal transporter [Patescibacteria group bacterium]
MEAIILSFVTFLSTSLGGFFALSFHKKLHLIMSLTAGVLLGVTFFDIMPEIFSISLLQKLDPTPAFISLVVGFLAIHVLEKFAVIHHSHEEEYAVHKHPSIGLISASGLSLHSFLDGVGIGLAYHVNSHVGLLVAIAVIAHDFSDGLNTVTLMLTHKNTRKKAILLLAIDAIAPVLGAASTLLFVIPQTILLLYLGFFAGFLLYIGASDLLPEAHSEHSSFKMIGLTIFGALFIFLVTRFI